MASARVEVTAARSMRRSRVLVCALASWSVLAFAQDGPPEFSSGWVDRKPVVAHRFMVAAANPLAVDAGYAILRRGGSAVDAAIAVQLVLGLVEPQSSGLGGGGFMLVHDAKRGNLIAYDGRETAPAAARSDRFLDSSGRPLAFFSAVIGGKSVGVPGTVALLAEAHKRHGRLPWAALFAPAIELAAHGFQVSQRLNALVTAEDRFVQPRARAYFYDSVGDPLAAGRTIKNPAYAATLRKIAAGGARAFYEGDVARDIVATVTLDATNPGDMTLADLAGYRVEVRKPVCGSYREYRVCGMPLPSSGGPTVLQMLAILEPYDVRAMGPATMWSVHFISEAGRLAYADRSVYMADPAFYSPPSGLLDRGYLAERSRLIRTDVSIGRAQPGMPPDRQGLHRVASGDEATPEFPSTSHISIVDAEGNAVAMTTTIEYGFGSHLMTEGGFLLNNELTDFSFVPTANGRPVANRVEPGKRPRSSMSPTIVYDRGGRIYMIVGSAGGPPIINYVVKTLVAVLDWGLDPQAATALPNFGSRNGPTELEAGPWAEAIEPKLRALGHQTRVSVQTSGLQAILRTKNGWIGGADPRREGAVRGD
jgi:gamma-glutamyltranspeptidase/glutathione hydrolase